jgi:hypothetical protein
LCCAYLTLPVCTQRIFQPKSKKKEKRKEEIHAAKENHRRTWERISEAGK